MILLYSANMVVLCDFQMLNRTLIPGIKTYMVKSFLYVGKFFSF